MPKENTEFGLYPNLKHSTLFGIPGIINGRQVGQMILDTASGITQVHQRWVPKEAMTGGNVRVYHSHPPNGHSMTTGE